MFLFSSLQPLSALFQCISIHSSLHLTDIYHESLSLLIAYYKLGVTHWLTWTAIKSNPILGMLGLKIFSSLLIDMLSNGVVIITS